jgi:hypothetical protein
VSPIARRGGHCDERAHGAETSRNRQRNEVGQAGWRSDPTSRQVVSEFVRHQDGKQTGGKGHSLPEVEVDLRQARHHLRAGEEAGEHRQSEQGSRQRHSLAGSSEGHGERQHLLAISVARLAQQWGAAQRAHFLGQAVVCLFRRQQQPAAQADRIGGLYAGRNIFDGHDGSSRRDDLSRQLIRSSIFRKHSDLSYPGTRNRTGVYLERSHRQSAMYHAVGRIGKRHAVGQQPISPTWKWS